ncbi:MULTISPECIES: 3-hydroxyacyl-CoA dehydrogenase [Spongiibacter]|jgi:3-hydroxyacyl-CoA dehydrogenase/3-hydroxy-2-methylbutyryl-CoA dehydrogenase|uniref:3-hydroxyacyl-CoA dehydrogenase n=2 Tax=Spongiibacteraceae TaxID=1706375 RepID=UPI0003B47C77|nr:MULTISPECIES: 3-hydroxyacyl-CoA dehydrogenase [Spongiibacter]MAY37417.1 3-hydroxyacyl-CoA dehydrogenase [Spongiibacter sp.]MBI59564.1 3-hydroxyacyl-CoA dehydrogenase [Spongiibacter sp.]MBU73667.1 3-hydroxyacyl-CoA dehydrogenase [Spongiibacter sp.]|tara:strand:- start:34903 stop:35676 length:774 start_codon:yes stop_codon:yes gene_type:complete
MDVNGKVALVTGGASGLGRATVEMIVAAGGKVAILDMNEGLGNALVAELGADNCLFAATNVADEASVQAAVDATLAKFGAIHICCNFAGIGNAIKTVSKNGAFPLDQFKRVVDVNLIGTFNVLRLAAEVMSKQDPLDDFGGRGVIINTASVAAFDGQIGQAAYSASKGGVVGMTLPIARDLASYGIRVNTIAPGLIDTPLLATLPEEARQSLAASVLNPKRLGLPEEIASLAMHIISNDYLNAEVIRMDGGIRMQPR